jgi:hypothetical protein
MVDCLVALGAPRNDDRQSFAVPVFAGADAPAFSFARNRRRTPPHLMAVMGCAALKPSCAPPDLTLPPPRIE